MRTSDDKKRFLETLTEYPLVSVAAKRTGIAKSTIYRWKERSSIFAARMEKALRQGRDAICDLAVGQIIVLIQRGDFRAAKFYLENNKPEYIKPRPITIFTNQKGIPLTFKNGESNITGNKITFEDFSEGPNKKKRKKKRRRRPGKHTPS